jgi:hypothetical protein
MYFHAKFKSFMQWIMDNVNFKIHTIDFVEIRVHIDSKKLFYLIGL